MQIPIKDSNFERRSDNFGKEKPAIDKDFNIINSCILGIYIRDFLSQKPNIKDTEASLIRHFNKSIK